MDYAKKNGYLHLQYFVDLSRFGRGHVETSRYLEIIYPTLGVKFVAIQERVDTETGEGTEMMPFHNIFNEWYAAQTSKKVRAVWAMKAANGKRSNFRVPYGYKRDELDKEKWLVDEAAAEVVRKSTQRQRSADSFSLNRRCLLTRPERTAKASLTYS